MSGLDITHSASLATKAALSATGTLALTVGGAAVTVVVARVLGPTGTGDVAYATWAAVVGSQIGGLALPQVAMRYLAADPGSGAAIARWVASRSGTSALAAAALAAAIAHTGMRAPTTGLVVMTAVLAAAQTIGTAGQALLAGTQAFRALAAISGVSAAVQVGGVTVQDCDRTGEPPVQPLGDEVRTVRVCVPFVQAPHVE